MYKLNFAMEVWYMNIEIIKENVNATNYIGHEKRNTNVEGEVNVPDIKPDILSIINVSNRVFVTNKSVVDGRIKVEGTVDVFIIYLSDDEHSTLHGINNTFNFTEYIDLNGVNEDSFLKLKCTTTSPECKVVNGRKLNIKCPIILDVEAAKEEKCEVGKDIADNRNIELKKENVNFKTLQFCKCENVSISETINLSDGLAPIGEILRATIQIVGKDYKTSYNKILAKADAIIKIIYIADNENGSVETFETKIPVMGFIDVDGLTENMKVNLEYNVKCFNVKPVYQDLKANAIMVNSDIEICAYIYNDVKFDVISDLYCTSKKINTEFDTLNIMQNNVNATENIEINQSLLIPELDMLNILNIDANPVISEINVLDGKIALEGNIEFNVLYYRNDKALLETKKIELPFQQVIKINELQSNMNPQISIEIGELEYRDVGGNQEQIRLNMNVCVLNNQDMEIMSLKNVEASNENLPQMPSIIVYYVKKGDSLWSIAKKFNTTVNEIKILNNLNDDTIYPNQELIIINKRAEEKVESLL